MMRIWMTSLLRWNNEYFAGMKVFLYRPPIVDRARVHETS